MTDTQTEKGQFRFLAPDEIAAGVVNFRKQAGWKQITLAHEAGVTERTVQRVERGEKVDEETLRRIGRALRLTESAFVGPRYIPTEDETIASVEKALRDIRVVDIQVFSQARDFDAILSVHGHLIDDSAAPECLGDEFAGFKDMLQDWGDIYSEIPHSGKLDACRDLLAHVRNIESKGFEARFGLYTTDDDLKVAVVMFLAGC